MVGHSMLGRWIDFVWLGRQKEEVGFLESCFRVAMNRSFENVSLLGIILVGKSTTMMMMVNTEK